VARGGAVHPDGFGVVDHDGEDFHHAVLGGHGAGINAGYVGHHLVDGLAGLGEGGLGDGVVLGVRISVLAGFSMVCF